MSDIVKFIFYYGPGTVQTNKIGVDLSEFAYIEVPLNDPQKWSISQVRNWLTNSLGLNTGKYTVGVHALWTRSSSNVNFYLRPIERRSQWVHWIQGCANRGCNPVALVLPVLKEVSAPKGHGGYDPGQSSEGMHMQNDGDDAPVSGQNSEVEGGTANGYDSGEVDADEVDGHMQNQMEEEDTDDDTNDEADDSDESDEEDNIEKVPNPASWNQDFSSAMTVNDGHDFAWLYHQNNIAMGAMYPNKEALKDATINWAMSTIRVFRTKVSSQKYLTMVCTNMECPSRVHAYLPKYDTSWVISDLVHHTCVIPSIPQDLGNLSSTLIARLFYTEIVECKVMEVKAIQTKVFGRLKYNISYGKAWRAKHRALETRFGSFFDAYDSVVRLLHTLQDLNPGTYVDIQDLFMSEFPTVRVLHRPFFSFGVCIEAFTHCRLVICVDGKGQILTAIGQDGQNQVVPLAFAFVESENIESWTWFFRQLKIAVVQNKPNVCILHDRHAGILSAIKKLTNPGPDGQTPWLDLQSRWCMRHLGANFFSQFRNKNLMNLFKKLFKHNQVWKYNLIRQRLNVCTQRHIRDRKAAQDAAVWAQVEAVAAQLATGTAAVEEESVGLCDLPGFDPPGTRRRVGRTIKTFEQWIEHEPLERWSLLHDTHGARYGVMTTNLAETYNFVLRGNRALPLTALVEGIFYGTVKYFRDRRAKAEMHMMNNPNTRYCERVMKYMDEKMEKAMSHTVVAIGNQERRFEVRLANNKFGCANEMRTHEVKIGNEVWPTCECTCNKPKLLHLPCSHVLAACRLLGMDAISFVSPYFVKEAVLNTWTGELQGFRAMGNFNTVNPVERRYIPDPTNMRTSRGRRQCQRIRNDMDESEAGGRTMQCILCNLFGHRDTSCPTFVTGGAAVRGRGNRGRRGGRGRGRS